jgi:hypothetical protein
VHCGSRKLVVARDLGVGGAGLRGMGGGERGAELDSELRERLFHGGAELALHRRRRLGFDECGSEIGDLARPRGFGAVRQRIERSKG